MLGKWEPANHGAGKLRWFVYRVKNTAYPGGPMEVYSSRDGKYIRYGSYEAAKRAANKLNTEVSP